MIKKLFIYFLEFLLNSKIEININKSRKHKKKFRKEIKIEILEASFRNLCTQRGERIIHR